mgnify:FL=1
MLLEFLDPTDQIGVFQNAKVLRRGLPSHVEVLAELAECLSVPLHQQIKQPSSGRVTECLEDLVCVHWFSRVGHESNNAGI